MLLCVTLYLLHGVPVFNLDIPPIYAKILDELSWTLKVKLLKDFNDATSITKIATTKSARRVGIEAFVIENPERSGNLILDKKTDDKSIYINNAIAANDLSEYLRDDSGINSKGINDVKDTRFIAGNPAIVQDKDYINSFTQKADLRRHIRDENGHFIKSREDRKFIPRQRLRSSSLKSSKMGRRQVGNSANIHPAAESLDDENNMRMKLFRLMYETVRDSDLKVKRAELIKTHYHNYSAFDIGYLMGDITDKYNIMHDISSTLERLYHEWKPLEHINAYEQIANQAIQISHLIDMMRHINKRNSTV